MRFCIFEGFCYSHTRLAGVEVQAGSGSPWPRGLGARTLRSGVARAATLPGETRALGLGCFLTVSFHLLLFSQRLIVGTRPLAFRSLTFSRFLPLCVCSVPAALSAGLLLALTRGLPSCPSSWWHLALKAVSPLVLATGLAVLECPPLMASVGPSLRGVVISGSCGEAPPTNRCQHGQHGQGSRHCAS